MMELHCYDYITVVSQRAIPALNKIDYLSYIYRYMYTIITISLYLYSKSEKYSDIDIDLSFMPYILCKYVKNKTIMLCYKNVVMLQHSTKINDN